MMQLNVIWSSFESEMGNVVILKQMCRQTAVSCSTEASESAASLQSDPMDQNPSWLFVT